MFASSVAMFIVGESLQITVLRAVLDKPLLSNLITLSVLLA